MSFDGMQGTFVKRDAEGCYFMSKKGIWRPMKFTSYFDPSQLVAGNKYGLVLENKMLNQVVDLGPNRFFEQNLAEHQGGGAPMQQGAQRVQVSPTSFTHPSPAPAASGIRPDGLMASATGVVKSCLEGASMDIDDAVLAGLRWAALWGELPPAARERLDRAGKAPGIAAIREAVDEIRAEPDPDDAIPF